MVEITGHTHNFDAVGTDGLEHVWSASLEGDAGRVGTLVQKVNRVLPYVEHGLLMDVWNMLGHMAVVRACVLGLA